MQYRILQRLSMPQQRPDIALVWKAADFGITCGTPGVYQIYLGQSPDPPLFTEVAQGTTSVSFDLDAGNFYQFYNTELKRLVVLEDKDSQWSLTIEFHRTAQLPCLQIKSSRCPRTFITSTSCFQFARSSRFHLASCPIFRYCL